MAIEYSDEGSGKTIVMLHGWADNLHTFDAIVRELPNYRIVRLDMPGFGGSERPRETWGVGEYVAFVRDFLQKMNITEYALVGHSFGGRVAIKGVGTEALYPTKVVLIASAGIKKDRTLKNEILRVVAKAGKALTLVPPFSAYRQQIRKRLYTSIGSDYFAAGSMRDIFLKVVGEDLLHYAKQIRVPALLVWGSEDRSTPVANGEKIHRAINGSQLKVIEGASHFVHQEHPQQIAQYIKAFI